MSAWHWWRGPESRTYCGMDYVAVVREGARVQNPEPTRTRPAAEVDCPACKRALLAPRDVVQASRAAPEAQGVLWGGA